MILCTSRVSQYRLLNCVQFRNWCLCKSVFAKLNLCYQAPIANVRTHITVHVYVAVIRINSIDTNCGLHCIYIDNKRFRIVNSYSVIVGMVSYRRELQLSVPIKFSEIRTATRYRITCQRVIKYTIMLKRISRHQLGSSTIVAILEIIVVTSLYCNTLWNINKVFRFDIDIILGSPWLSRWVRVFLITVHVLEPKFTNLLITRYCIWVYSITFLNQISIKGKFWVPFNNRCDTRIIVAKMRI